MTVKYYPETDSIVHPYQADGFAGYKLWPLRIVKPEIEAGDTMIANTPTLDGGEYVLTYTVLKAGSDEQRQFMEERA